LAFDATHGIAEFCMTRIGDLPPQRSIDVGWQICSASARLPQSAHGLTQDAQAEFE